MNAEPREQDVDALAHLIHACSATCGAGSLVIARSTARHILASEWFAERIEREPATEHATPCPVCGGAGIVDTSPPGVEERP